MQEYGQFNGKKKLSIILSSKIKIAKRNWNCLRDSHYHASFEIRGRESRLSDEVTVTQKQIFDKTLSGVNNEYNENLSCQSGLQCSCEQTSASPLLCNVCQCDLSLTFVVMMSIFLIKVWHSWSQRDFLRQNDANNRKCIWITPHRTWIFLFSVFGCVNMYCLNLFL